MRRMVRMKGEEEYEEEGEDADEDALAAVGGGLG